MVKTEDDALDPTPVASMRETSAAMTYLDDVVAAGGIALRYGGFYGAANDGLIQPVRSGSSRLSARVAASPLSSTSMTPPPRPCWHSSTTGRRSTTSSTMSPRLCASGCRCLPTPSERSRHVTPRMARTGHRGRGGSDAGDGGPRRLQREGKARARLDAAPRAGARGSPRSTRRRGARRRRRRSGRQPAAERKEVTQCES